MQNRFSEDAMIKYWQLLNYINSCTPDEKNIEKVLSVILTFVTAEKGLGFNRAILMLKNDENILEAVLSVGLSSYTETNELWSNIYKSYEDMIVSCEQLVKQRKLAHIVDNLKVALNSEESVLAKTVLERQPLLITPEQINTTADKKIVEILQTDTFVSVPLIAQGNVIGIILADNLFTRKPITDGDVKLLSVFAGQAAAALENARLYQELQQQLKDAKQMQLQLLQIKHHTTSGEMGAAVVHELHNPLIAIGGFARRLHRNLPPTDSSREMTGIIIKEVDRLERLLEQLRTFSHSRLYPQEQCDVNHIAQDTLKLMGEKITQNHIILHTEFADDLPPVLVGDDEVKQVLLNIILNAIQAMPDGGKLFVKTMLCDVIVRVEVKDTGPGIPDEILNNIFQPRFTTKSDGSGLGLAISNQIIKAHGGDIKVKSQIDVGTTFLINLPAEAC